MLQKIKSKIHAIIFWQTSLGDFVNKCNDIKIFYKYSFSLSKLKSKENYEAYLYKQYHIIEKGLALPNPREGFGVLKIKELINISNEYIKKYEDDKIIKNIKATLAIYIERNANLKETNNQFYTFINEFINKQTLAAGGVKKLSFIDIKKYTNIDIKNFIISRTSVRNFSKEDVEQDAVYKAVELARFTPSVCNRQSWKVYYFKDKSIQKELLELQGGNNGFTESINQLLIITTDTKKFTKLESNQVFVDGGLFAMNLLIGLHAQQIASCCLNTCLPFTIENKIKTLANIPESQRLIMMIGIGKFKNNFEVAISDKKTAQEIIVKFI